MKTSTVVPPTRKQKSVTLALFDSEALDIVSVEFVFNGLLVMTIPCLATLISTQSAIVCMLEMVTAKVIILSHTKNTIFSLLVVIEIVVSLIDEWSK